MPIKNVSNSQNRERLIYENPIIHRVIEKLAIQHEMLTGTFLRIDLEKSEKLFEELDHCSSNTNRVAYVLRLLEDEQFPSLKCSNQKNKNLSTEQRENGNVLFHSNDLKDALKKYTESISLAPNNSTCLALAYANRAAVLKLLGYFQDSINDTLRAIEYGYPEETLHKLHVRLGQCFEQLDQHSNAVEHFNKALACIQKSSKMNQEERNELSEKLHNDIKCCKSTAPAKPKIKKPVPKLPKVSHSKNPNIPSASTRVTIKLDEKGPHFVAAEEIQPGNVLLVDTGFAACLIPHTRYTHCSHCFKACYTLLPCTGCKWTLFCSEECRDLSFKYHEWECSTVPPSFIDDLSSIELLIVRVISKFGLEKWASFLQTHKLQAASSNNNSELFNPKNDQQLHSSDPNILMSCEEILPKARMAMASRVFTVTMIVKYLNLVDHPAYDDLIELLMKLTNTAILNMNEYRQCRTVEFAHACSPFWTMFRNNCSPNALFNFYGGSLVVRAVCSIPKGHPITFALGENRFWQVPKRTRQETHRKWSEECKCEACEKNWPTFDFITHNMEMVFPNDAKFCTAFQTYIHELGNKDKDVDDNLINITTETLPLLLRLIAICDKADKKLCQLYLQTQDRLWNYYYVQANAYTNQLLM